MLTCNLDVPIVIKSDEPVANLFLMPDAPITFGKWIEALEGGHYPMTTSSRLRTKDGLSPMGVYCELVRHHNKQKYTWREDDLYRYSFINTSMEIVSTGLYPDWMNMSYTVEISNPMYELFHTEMSEKLDPKNAIIALQRVLDTEQLINLLVDLNDKLFDMMKEEIECSTMLP